MSDQSLLSQNVVFAWLGVARRVAQRGILIIALVLTIKNLEEFLEGPRYRFLTLSHLAQV